MNKRVDVARAWKDEAYRASLTDEERAALPEHPVGSIDLEDAQLARVTGSLIRRIGGAVVAPLRNMEPDLTTASAYCSIKWCR